MSILPTEIFSVADVREIDRRAIEMRGIPGYTLMRRAGGAATAAARRRWPDAGRWLVLCGAGNNAGDGYVVAREAARAGIDVVVSTLADPENLAGDAAKAWRDWLDAGGSTRPWDGSIGADRDLIVDALLGSGLERPVRGRFADAVDAVNASSSPVLALDIPTGIHGDTGMRLGSGVIADATMTFVGLKAGLFLGAGADLCGDLEFDALDIPADCLDGLVPVLRRPEEARFRELFAPRRRSAHKGDFGHVLVIGGGAGMPGAAILCGESALRAGAGKVSVATDAGHAALLAVARPELMAHGVADRGGLDQLLAAADVIVVGPGLGRSSWAQEMLDAALSSALPAVLDADALNLMAERRPRQVTARAERVITPHPGEAARLLGKSASDVQGDRRAAVLELQQAYGAVAVLKGARTLIAAGDSVPFVCTAGNPGMATAGMGDALAGIVAAFCAQGMSVADAAVFGVEAHARAGDVAATGGERGLLASDLLGALRGVINPTGRR